MPGPACHLTSAGGSSSKLERRRKGIDSLFDGGLGGWRDPNASKLDKATEVACENQLYRPILTTKPDIPSEERTHVIPTNDIFSQRLHATNGNYLTTNHSRTSPPWAPPEAHALTDAVVVEDSEPFMNQQLSHRHESETPETIPPQGAINTPLGPAPTRDETLPLQPAIGTAIDGGTDIFPFLKLELSQQSEWPRYCLRISPNTGEPCNMIFCGPYDMNSHIKAGHNAHEQKVLLSP